MALKKFLRPTKGKIVLVIVLSLLAIFVNVAGGRARVTPIHEGGKVNELKVQIFESVGMTLFLPIHLIGKFIIAPRTSKTPSLDLLYPLSFKEILLLYGSVIFYWYLLSCLIVFIYQKLRYRSWR